MSELVRRSTLLVPAIEKGLVGRSWSVGADALCLDLEESVHPAQKLKARAMIKETLSDDRKKGTEVLVRINKGSTFADLQASVWPGLQGVIVPKAESSDEIREIERTISYFEIERKMEPGRTEIKSSY